MAERPPNRPEVAPFELGHFRILPARNRVEGPNGTEKLEPRVMQVLVCLASRADEVVSREDILEEVWQNRFVSDEVLTVAIQKLRRVLGDEAKDARFVQTVPGKGYRLNEVTRDASAEPAETPSPTTRASTGTVAVVAGVVLLAGLVAIVVAVVGSRPPEGDRRSPRRIAIDPPPEALADSFAVSPDGTKLAFVAPNADGVDVIWVRDLESGASDMLAGTDNVWRFMWSPDSLQIAFGTPIQLKRISLAGGAPETLAETGMWGGGAWSDDDVLLFSGDTGKLFRTGLAGGAPEPIDDGLAPDAMRMFPFFLPDGAHFLYFVPRAFERGSIYVGSLESNTSTFVVESDSKAVFADEHLVFVLGSTVNVQPFDSDELRITGQPTRLGAQLMPASVLGGQDTSLSVSRNGVLVLRGGAAPAGQLVWFDREGQELNRVPQPTSGEYVNPSLSPDGRTLAVNRRDPATGNADIWLIDVTTNRASRFTTSPSPETDLIWSPDGARVAYAAHRDGQFGVWTQPTARGEEAFLWPAPAKVHLGVIPTDWSREDLLFVDYTLAPFQSWSVPVSGTRSPWSLFDSQHFDVGARLSPNERWLAYTSSETGNFEVHVVRFPEMTGKQRLSLSGGGHPRWREDGKELFFWRTTSRHGTVMRVDMEEEDDGSSLRVGVPEPLFDQTILGFLDARSHYTATPDGQRFLLRRPSLNPPPVTIIVDWTAQLERR